MLKMVLSQCSVTQSQFCKHAQQPKPEAAQLLTPFIHRVTIWGACLSIT